MGCEAWLVFVCSLFTWCAVAAMAMTPCCNSSDCRVSTPRQTDFDLLHAISASIWAKKKYWHSFYLLSVFAFAMFWGLAVRPSTPNSRDAISTNLVDGLGFQRNATDIHHVSGYLLKRFSRSEVKVKTRPNAIMVEACISKVWCRGWLVTWSCIGSWFTGCWAE